MAGYSPAKNVKVRTLMSSHKSDYAILTETRQRLHRQLAGKGKPYCMEGEGLDPAGVSMVYPSNIGCQSILKQDRICSLTLPNNIHIIGVYGPNETTKLTTKTDFWTNLNDIVKAAVSRYHIVLVIGDFNAGNEPLLCKRPDGGPNYNRLHELMQQHKLKWIESGPTWRTNAVRNTQALRTLDRCLIHSTTDFESEATVSWEDRLSDHAVLSIGLSFPSIDRNQGRPFYSGKPNTTSINTLWQSTKALLRKRQDQAEDKAENALQVFWKTRNDIEMAKKEGLILIDDNGNTLSSQEATNTAALYLSSLWKATNNDISLPTTRALSSPTPPPSLREVHKAITMLKRNTATGKDGISSNSVLDNPNSAEIYMDLLSAIWTMGCIPQEWKDMRVKPIPKTNPTATIGKTRPITCLSTSTKVLNSLLAERGRLNYEKALHPGQHAYRKHRSVWTAKRELMLEIKQSGPCIVAMLDMSKAFDKVTRKALLLALKHWNIPLFEQELIIEQYKDGMVYVELNGKEASPFPHCTGVRQGCVLSGMLFNLVISIVHHQLEARLQKTTYHVLSYSDDIIIIAKDNLTIKVVTKVLEEELQHMGLVLNQDKTQKVNFLSGIQPPTTTEWLGTLFSSELTWDDEINARLQKAKKAGQEIKELCRDNNLRIAESCMINIVETLVVTHLKVKLDVASFTQIQTDSATNAVTAILLDTTKMTESKASTTALELLGLQAKPKRDKRKTFHSKDRPPLPDTTLEGPTPEEIAKRKQQSSQLQEERRWCTLCNPPEYYKDINGHRKRIHNAEALPRLLIHCLGCKRSIDSARFHMHICASETRLEGMEPCPHCLSMYGKIGLSHHIGLCKGNSSQVPKLT